MQKGYRCKKDKMQQGLRCNSCLTMIIQPADLLGQVKIPKPYTFKSEFRTVVRCTVSLFIPTLCT